MTVNLKLLTIDIRNFIISESFYQFTFRKMVAAGATKKKRVSKKSGISKDTSVAVETVLEDISYATTSNSGTNDVVKGGLKSNLGTADQSPIKAGSGTAGEIVKTTGNKRSANRKSLQPATTRGRASSQGMALQSMAVPKVKATKRSHYESKVVLPYDDEAEEYEEEEEEDDEEEDEEEGEQEEEEEEEQLEEEDEGEDDYEQDVHDANEAHAMLQYDLDQSLGKNKTFA